MLNTKNYTDSSTGDRNLVLLYVDLLKPKSPYTYRLWKSYNSLG